MKLNTSPLTNHNLTYPMTEASCTSKVLSFYHKGQKIESDALDILMIEAQSNYSNIFLCSGLKILTSKSLKYWTTKLDASNFIRIHAKYYIQSSYIKHWNKSKHIVTLENGASIKISRRSRKDVYRLLK